MLIAQRPSLTEELLGVLLMEFGDFAMLRKMLRGIKARAESLVQDAGRIGSQGEHHTAAGRRGQERADGPRHATG